MATESVADLAQSRNKNQPIDTAKVAKLVRLLGSDQDGEIVAAVAALRRTLGVAGIDLHDLADVITVGLEPRSPQASETEVVAAWARSIKLGKLVSLRPLLQGAPERP
jgi:hypothetical protein